MRFKETSQAMEIAVGVNIANNSDQCFRVNQFFEWHVLQIKLSGNADHHAIEFLFRLSLIHI